MSAWCHIFSEMEKSTVVDRIGLRRVMHKKVSGHLKILVAQLPSM
jgi:hypothetical protein